MKLIDYIMRKGYQDCTKEKIWGQRYSIKSIYLILREEMILNCIKEPKLGSLKLTGDNLWHSHKDAAQFSSETKRS